jgi:hypothetical protein
MYMVRHDYELVYVDFREMLGKVLPTGLDDASESAQAHLLIDNPTEQVPPVLRTDRNEVRAGLRIVIVRKADRVLVSFVSPLHHGGHSSIANS